MLAYLINIGVNNSMPRHMMRQTRLTNAIIFILAGFGVVLFVPIIIDNGFNSTAYLVLFSIGLMLLLLKFNQSGYINTTRFVVSFYPPLMIISATLITKLLKPEAVGLLDFMDGRFLLVGMFIIPFLLFSYKEKGLLFGSLSIPFLLVFLFDPIHNLFGVGYQDFFGDIPNSYIASGIYIDISLIFLAGTVYYFKANIESLLQKNHLLNDDLGEKNSELSELFEELEHSNEGLRNNEKVIKNQKDQLEKSNSILVDEVENKTVELRLSNEELVKYNNELQQFSNTLSHNLRGPVANLLGLSQLFKLDKSDEKRSEIADHIYKSADALDGVIKDLNKIVELRNNLFQIKERIDIENEVNDIWLILESSVAKCNGKLEMNINAPVTYGVRSYFHSILYNLISNGIKYRHPDRDCLVTITTNKLHGECEILVQDNGIGVDLEKHSEKMFGMYNRFHTHLEGKGLGLFLTKQQIEAMGGSISVVSEINIGSTFIVRFPTVSLSKVESQLFYQSEVADIYLDAVNKITTLLWKKMPNPSEFTEVFTNNIEVFSSYKSDKWIVDLRLMTNLGEVEKQWVLDSAIDQYLKVGIKKIALIRGPVKKESKFWKKFDDIIKIKALEVIIAESVQDAKSTLIKS